MTQILLVEDEKNLGSTLCEYLQDKGHEVFWAKTVAEARQFFQSEKIKVIFMDIGLPDGNGLDLAGEFRQQNKNASLLFLSALNAPDTRLKGFEIGADDYITKPFELKELLLRLKKITHLQKNASQHPDEISLGKLKICFSKYELQDALGNTIPLTQRECAILEYLFDKKNIVVSRDEIIENIWGEESYPTNRTVDNYIVKFRKWSETDQSSAIEIESIRGIGYKLVIK